MSQRESDAIVLALAATEPGSGQAPARPLLLAALLLALAGGRLPALAQTATPALDLADPGQIERRIEERETPTAEPEPEIPLPEIAPRPAAPADDEAEVVLTAVTVEGATALDPATLAESYRPYIGEAVGLADIGAILDAMTAAYREAGFILSRAIAPPQDLAGGALRVRIVEGHLEKVTFQGARPGRWGLGAYAARLEAERPLTLDTLERVILLIEDLPGLGVASRLRPIDDEAGRYELILTLEEDRFDAGVYLDNRGTPAVGRFQAFTSLGANGAFSQAERLQLGFFTVPNQPEELLYGDLLYVQPLFADGLTAGFRVSRSRVDAGDDLAAFDTLSSSRGYEFSLRYPVIRSRAFNLFLGAAFDYRDFKEEQLDNDVLDDRLRVLRTTVDSAFSDGLEGVNFVSLEVSQGLDILNASGAGGRLRSRADGEPDFTKVTLNAVRQQALPENFAVQIALRGQGSLDPLLSSEEFALGGSRFGRAYDFSEITGEHGLVGSVELRYGDELPLDWLPGFQLYGFYDRGAVWNDLPGGGKDRESLSSAGGGLRFRLLDLFQGGLELAFPLTRQVRSEGDKAPRLFFSLSGDF